MAPRAQFETKSAFLFTDFGLEMAKRWFTAEQIAAMGVYGPRSKHAGKPKGQISWVKVSSGGWVSHGAPGHGHVESRVGKTIEASLQTAEWNQAPMAVFTANSPLVARQTAADEYLGKAAAHSVGFFLSLFEMRAKLIDLGIEPTPIKYVSPF